MADALSVLLAVLMFASPLLATDTVTPPHRSQASPRKEIHIVEIDLTRPEVTIRATKTGERGRTPSSFSNLVGAAVVVNADFFSAGADPSEGEGEPSEGGGVRADEPSTAGA